MKNLLHGRFFKHFCKKNTYFARNIVQKQNNLENYQYICTKSNLLKQ